MKQSEVTVISTIFHTENVPSQTALSGSASSADNEAKYSKRMFYEKIRKQTLLKYHSAAFKDSLQ